MTDYSDAASNALDALTDASEGMVEEYEIRSNGRRVKRGRVKDQVEAAVLLQALAARQSGGLFRLAKPKAPR
jgi:hypothetical protein